VKRFLRLEIHHVAVSGFAASSLGKRKLLGHINNVKHVNPDLGSELHAALKATGLLTGRREGKMRVWRSISIMNCSGRSWG
jgi:hypothetical protein